MLTSGNIRDVLSSISTVIKSTVFSTHMSERHFCLIILCSCRLLGPSCKSLQLRKYVYNKLVNLWTDNQKYWYTHRDIYNQSLLGQRETPVSIPFWSYQWLSLQVQNVLQDVSLQGPVFQPELLLHEAFSPKPQNVAFCPVRTSRRFRRLATPRRRRPHHTLQYGTFPLAQARGRGGASGNARGGRSPRRLPPAPQECREPRAGPRTACWEMESFTGKGRSRWLGPGGTLGNAVYNLWVVLLVRCCPCQSPRNRNKYRPCSQ